MYMVKPGIWCCKYTQGGGDMAMHLSTLAPKAGTSPFPDIHIDAWPHIPAGHKTLCGTNARLRNRVQRIENRPAETLRDVRVLDASGDIPDNQDSLREERDTLEVEGRMCTQPGSFTCNRASSRKSTTEVSLVWRAFVSRRERASAAVLADPCT